MFILCLSLLMVWRGATPSALILVGVGHLGSYSRGPIRPGGGPPPQRWLGFPRAVYFALTLVRAILA